jgi:hypothetical protein
VALDSGHYRAAFDWVDDDGRKATNVLHFHKTGTGLAEAVANQIKSGPGTAGCGPCTEHIAVKQITVVNMTDDSDGFVITSGITNWTGGGSGDYSPGLSAVLRLHTSHAGRSGKGRVFLPMVSEASLTLGRFVGDALTATAPAWEDWNIANIGSTVAVAQQVYSSTHDQAFAVGSYSLNPIPGFRRKRANEA